MLEAQMHRSAMAVGGVGAARQGVGLTVLAYASVRVLGTWTAARWAGPRCNSTSPLRAIRLHPLVSACLGSFILLLLLGDELARARP